MDGRLADGAAAERQGRCAQRELNCYNNNDNGLKEESERNKDTMRLEDWSEFGSSRPLRLMMIMHRLPNIFIVRRVHSELNSDDDNEKK